MVGVDQRAGLPRVDRDRGGLDRVGGFTVGQDADGVGSVLGIVNAATGALAATYSYDPYGRDTGTTGTPSLNQFRYAGAYRDTTGFYHMGDRYYDPATGRFTQPDPTQHPGDLAQGNPYPYAADNPVNYTDPTGQDIFSDVVSSVISTIGGTLTAASGYVTFLAYAEFAGEATLFTTSALFASFGPVALVATTTGFLAYEVLQ